MNADVKKRLGLTNNEEPINETQACEFLGIKKNTMRKYVCEGKLKGTYVINVLGKRMYFKSKLILY